MGYFSLLLLIFASSTTYANGSFCGFFVNREPLTVEFQLGDLAKVSFQGHDYNMVITERRMNGYPHGSHCDERFCLTEVEYTLTSRNSQINIHDYLDTAKISGELNGISFAGAAGRCE